MSVKNAVVSRVLVIMIMVAERFHFAYQLSAIIVVRKVWLSACSMTMTRNSSSGLRTERLAEEIKGRGLYLFRVQSALVRPHLCTILPG